MYVSKSNEGSQLMYIQPGAQGCRGGGLALAWGSGLPPQSAELDALCTYICTYECAEVRKGLLELPPIYNLYLCMYVCM